MIRFHTCSEMDLAALSTFGLHAKETDSPIGQFGTGLKYALAVLAREGCKVHIKSGSIELDIETERQSFRGKDFDFVIGVPHSEPLFRLGFTTELGKGWEKWMAYRELWSNTMDESGTVLEDRLAPRGGTTISVEGLDDVHILRSEFLIDPEAVPLWENDEIQVFPGDTRYVFHQGIRAMELDSPTMHRFNIKKRQELTEDRTLLYTWSVKGMLARAIAECDIEDVVRDELASAFSEKVDWTDKKVSSTFAEVAQRSGATVPDKARLAATQVSVVAGSGSGVSSEQKIVLDEAHEKMKDFGIPVDLAVICATDSDPCIRGECLLIPERCFKDADILARHLIGLTAEVKCPVWQESSDYLAEKIVDKIWNR